MLTFRVGIKAFEILTEGIVTTLSPPSRVATTTAVKMKFICGFCILAVIACVNAGYPSRPYSAPAPRLVAYEAVPVVPAPTYVAPAYPSPSYSVPQRPAYRPAPVYTAPAYRPAPVYAAPVYRAPSYAPVVTPIVAAPSDSSAAATAAAASPSLHAGLSKNLAIPSYNIDVSEPLTRIYSAPHPAPYGPARIY